VRMQAHATDGGVFIRSMAARGHLGGLAAPTPQVLRVLELGGFGIVLVETVGVGQVEIDIAAMADTTVVLLAPGMGDGVQAAKAGLLEVADVLVVNKADRVGADETVRDLKRMLTTAQETTADGTSDAVGWRPDVVRAVATSEGGVAEVAAAIDRHRDWLGTSGEGVRRRHARVVAEIRAVALGMLVARANLQVDGAPELVELAGLVESGELDAFSAARQLLAASG